MRTHLISHYTMHGGTQLIPDYEYFRQLCTRVQTSAEVVRQFPDSGLIVFHLPPEDL